MVLPLIQRICAWFPPERTRYSEITGHGFALNGQATARSECPFPGADAVYLVQGYRSIAATSYNGLGTEGRTAANPKRTGIQPGCSLILAVLYWRTQQTTNTYVGTPRLLQYEIAKQLSRYL